MAMQRVVSVPFGSKIDAISVVEQSPDGRFVRYAELLGRGACKRVYRAIDTQDGREVAWNLVEFSGTEAYEDGDDLVMRQRLFEEISVLQLLRHKNVMGFHSWWFSAPTNAINFVTEMFSSGTLRQYRKRCRHVNEAVIKRWAWQILEGLVYLHGHTPPIVHRDLKCDNIFVNGSTGQIKIGDLGLATAQRGLSVVGTPEFMAPEVYEEQYDEKVDIYSFGMCLLELATCEYPYSECHGVGQIYRKVTTGVAPEAVNRVTSDPLRRLIELCISHLAASRPSARQLLKHPFFDSLRECGAPAPSSPMASGSSAHAAAGRFPVRSGIFPAASRCAAAAAAHAASLSAGGAVSAAAGAAAELTPPAALSTASDPALLLSPLRLSAFAQLAAQTPPCAAGGRTPSCSGRTPSTAAAAAARYADSDAEDDVLGTPSLSGLRIHSAMAPEDLLGPAGERLSMGLSSGALSAAYDAIASPHALFSTSPLATMMLGSSPPEHDGGGGTTSSDDGGGRRDGRDAESSGGGASDGPSGGGGGGGAHRARRFHWSVSHGGSSMAEVGAELLEVPLVEADFALDDGAMSDSSEEIIVPLEALQDGLLLDTSSLSGSPDMFGGDLDVGQRTRSMATWGSMAARPTPRDHSAPGCVPFPVLHKEAREVLTPTPTRLRHTRYRSTDMGSSPPPAPESHQSHQSHQSTLATASSDVLFRASWSFMCTGGERGDASASMANTMGSRLGWERPIQGVIVRLKKARVASRLYRARTL